MSSTPGSLGVVQARDGCNLWKALLLLKGKDMLSHAVFTVASPKCMLLVLHFCPSYSGHHTRTAPGEHRWFLT